MSPCPPYDRRPCAEALGNKDFDVAYDRPSVILGQFDRYTTVYSRQLQLAPLRPDS